MAGAGQALMFLRPPYKEASIQADLCIVGSGPASLTIARQYLGSRTRVVIMESGGADAFDFVSDLNEGEVFSTGQGGHLSYSLPDVSGLQASRYRDFGGTMNIWTGRIRPLDPSDFVKGDDISGAGWPVSLENLLPYYEKALYDLGRPDGLSGFHGASPLEQIFPINSTVARGLTHKTWGQCQSNFAADLHDEIERSGNVHVYLGCTATNIHVAGSQTNKSVTAIDCKTSLRQTVSVSATRYVLACGGIENARLLLLSQITETGGAKNAPASSSAWVGRCFMDHLRVPIADVLFSDNRRYFLHAPTEEDPVASEQYFLGPAEADIVARRINNGAVGFEPTGHECEFPWRWMALAAEYEQRPNPNSMLTLTDQKDALGSPRVKLSWAITTQDKNDMIELAHQVARAVFFEGRGRVRLRPQFANGSPYLEWSAFGNHHMGTTRMSVDPRHGVVDANLKVHDTANLFIAGSSVFPTGGASNPTLTIIALSRRLANHLAETAS